MFYFIFLCFPGFLGQFFMNGKAKFRKPCCTIGSQKFYWLIYLQRNTCDESFYTKISEDTRKRCLRHLTFTVSSPNRNVSFYAFIGKDIVANAGSTVMMMLCWFKISDPVIIFFWNSVGNFQVCDVTVFVYYWCSPLDVYNQVLLFKVKL